MSRGTAFPIRLHVCPAKTLISLRLRAGGSESTQGNLYVAKALKRLKADNEDSDQTARMRRLIGVFAGHTCNVIGNAVFRLVCE